MRGQPGQFVALQLAEEVPAQAGRSGTASCTIIPGRSFPRCRTAPRSGGGGHSRGAEALGDGDDPDRAGAPSGLGDPVPDQGQLSATPSEVTGTSGLAGISELTGASELTGTAEHIGTSERTLVPGPPGTHTTVACRPVSRLALHDQWSAEQWVQVRASATRLAPQCRARPGRPRPDRAPGDRVVEGHYALSVTCGYTLQIGLGKPVSVGRDARPERRGDRSRPERPHGCHRCRSTTPAMRPRQPAWTAATTPSGLARATGAQSAVLTTSAASGQAVTAASASCARRTPPGGRQQPRRFPCTWWSQVHGASASRPLALDRRPPHPRIGEITVRATPCSHLGPARQADNPGARRGQGPVSGCRGTIPAGIQTRKRQMVRDVGALLQERGDVEIVVVPKTEACAGQLHFCVDEGPAPGGTVEWRGHRHGLA